MHIVFCALLSHGPNTSVQAPASWLKVYFQHLLAISSSLAQSYWVRDLESDFKRYLGKAKHQPSVHEVTEKATLLFPYRALPCLGLEGSTCCSVSWRCCYQSPGHPLTAACVFAAAQMKLTMGFSLKATFSDSDVPCPVHIPPSRPDGGHAQDSMLLAVLRMC